MPTEFNGEIRSIEMHHEEIPKAEPGDNIGFSIRGLEMKDVGRGDCLGHPKDPPTVVTPKGNWTGQIIVIWHPTAIAQGYCPVIHAHTAQVAAKFVELNKKLDLKVSHYHPVIKNIIVNIITKTTNTATTILSIVKTPEAKDSKPRHILFISPIFKHLL